MKTSKDFRDRNIRKIEQRIKELETMGNQKDVIDRINYLYNLLTKYKTHE